MTEESRRPSRKRATVLSVLAAAIVLAGGAAAWFAVEAAALRTSDPVDNVALVDPAATAEVLDQVGAGVKAVFSYDYNNFARTERAARDVLADDAAARYQADFAAARQRAQTEKLVRTTGIRGAGVRELTGDRASVLLFLDQQTLREGAGPGESTTTAVEALAKKVDGRWKITALNPL